MVVELAVGWLDIVRVLTSERMVIGRRSAIKGAARKLKLDLDGEEMFRMPSFTVFSGFADIAPLLGMCYVHHASRSYPYIQIL